MTEPGTPPPPEFPPELLEEYLKGMRSTLGLLAAIAGRLTAAGNDREALEMLRRETHKIHGTAGAFGYMDASRLAAGMEATAKDWVAHPDEGEVDRGSLTQWFVARLAEMHGLRLPPPPASGPTPRPMPRVGPPPRPSRPTPAPSVRIPRPTPSPSPPPAAPVTTAPPPPAPKPRPPAPPPPPPKPKPEPPKPVEPPKAPVSPVGEDLPWLFTPEAAAEQPAPPPVPPAPPPAAEPPRAEAPAPAGTVPEVIYVEDDAALAELLAYGLGAREYRFAAYRNGREALQALLALDVQGTHPLLLLDVDLPALDGYSIFDALERERPGTYRVVFTTVHGTEEEQLRGLEAGALDYLVKPISLRVAMEKIKRWVGR